MNLSSKIKRIIPNVFKYFTLLLGSFIAVVPVAVCVITAFKTDEEYARTSVMTLPESWTYFDNFFIAWKKANMTVAFRNSFIVLVCVLVGSVLISSMIAYVLDRFKFKGNTLIRNLFLFATLIPGVAMQVTVYQIMYSMGLIDTLQGYILLLLGTDVISIYIFLQFYENIPKSLDESAIIDGASYFEVFFKIILPLSKPVVITTMILKGVSTYNEYYMANLYLHTKNKRQVVSTSLYTFTGPLGSQYNYICAGVLLTMIPALIIFILCQKHIYSGLTQGAVKG
ncbi:MAG TPA: carbohydrate ABC transporter permease [Epulopiscium sp.]|nr:carbohydrate ABC transporter permease [Candidatus Epulonipiscium sp.]